MQGISIIGAPTDVGACTPGSRMGPDALRVAGLARRLSRQGFDVADRGDLRGPADTSADRRQGVEQLGAVAGWNRLVHDAVLAELRLGRMPMLLGGDHSLAIGSISAVASHCRDQGRELRVIWLDAHADFNTIDTSPSGNLHGMPVACLCGNGPKALTHIGGDAPALTAGAIRQVGIRSVDDAERELVKAAGLQVFDMRRIDEIGMGEAMRQALAGMDADVHLHVSFDVDFLDPSIAPGVATTIEGGPSLREAQLCMEMLADTGRLGSLDVVELNPALDVRSRTAQVAVELVESLLGKSVLVRA